MGLVSCIAYDLSGHAVLLSTACPGSGYYSIALNYFRGIGQLTMSSMSSRLTPSAEREARCRAPKPERHAHHSGKGNLCITVGPLTDWVMLWPGGGFQNYRKRSIQQTWHYLGSLMYPADDYT